MSIARAEIGSCRVSSTSPRRDAVNKRWYPMIRMLPFALTAVLASMPPAAMAGGPVAFGPDLASRGWDVLTFRGRAPVAFAAEGTDGLAIRAEAAVSVLYRPLPEAFAGAGTAAWRWRVDAGPPPTDLAQRGGEDRAIALYFLFADDPDIRAAPPASLRAALRRGRALVYVWGGDGAERSAVPSPHMAGRGVMVLQRPADSATGVWLPERVDLRADFRRAFGLEPGPLVAVAVSSDSDDTGGVTEARLADLVLD